VTSSHPRVGDEGSAALGGAPGTTPDYADWASRYLEHAPLAVAVVRGSPHTLVYANEAFRQLGTRRGGAIGRPIDEALEPAAASELEALLDQVRRDGVVARDAIVLPGPRGAVSRHYTVWPVADRNGGIDQLVMVLLEGEELSEGALTRSRQTEIAEHLLLSALREQMLAEEAETARKRSALLAAAAVRLGSSLDRKTTYASMAGLALPRTGAWCVVDIVEADGTLHRLAIVHPDPAKEALVHGLERIWLPQPGDRFGVPLMMQSPHATVIADDIDVALAAGAHSPDTLHALRELGIGPLLVAPLLVRGTVRGAITFVSRRGDVSYTPAEVSLAEALATQCAAALESAQLYDVASAARASAEAAQRDAETANRAKSRFLSMMSHDLRSPLNAIGGYAQLLDLGVRGPLTEAQHTDLKRIKMSQEHLLGLIDRILSFARLEGGKVQYDISDVPLDATVRVVEVFVAPQMLDRRLEFRFEPPVRHDDSQLLVRADPEKLQQILTNLLANAIKFTEPGGQITVSYEARDADVSIHVRDTGRGIAADALELIFEPFAQLGRGLTSTAEGVGLGLAIGRELARGMGGDLTAESVLGKGSVFTLTLQRSHAPPRHAPNS
jgi:signal transduction histidine kinase